jgi:hypothetical protein
VAHGASYRNKIFSTQISLELLTFSPMILAHILAGDNMLLQMLQQLQQQHQRLLDMPRSALATPPAVPSALVDPGPPRGEIRRRIVALLRAHPDGLSPAQVGSLLRINKNLGNTMKAMVRDGLLRRVETGRYAAHEKSTMGSNTL